MHVLRRVRDEPFYTFDHEKIAQKIPVEGVKKEKASRF